MYLRIFSAFIYCIRLLLNMIFKRIKGERDGTFNLCTIGFLDSNFNEAVIGKISNFHEIASNFTYSQKKKMQYLKYNWNFLDQLVLPYKFYGRDM